MRPRAPGQSESMIRIKTVSGIWETYKLSRMFEPSRAKPQRAQKIRDTNLKVIKNLCQNARNKQTVTTNKARLLKNKFQQNRQAFRPNVVAATRHKSLQILSSFSLVFRTICLYIVPRGMGVLEGGHANPKSLPEGGHQPKVPTWICAQLGINLN